MPEMPKMPDKLYSFRKLNEHTMDELKNSYLYFSSASSLNDPMEGFYDIFFDKGKDQFFWRKLFEDFLSKMVKQKLNVKFYENRIEEFKNCKLNEVCDIANEQSPKVKEWHLKYMLMAIFRAFVEHTQIKNCELKKLISESENINSNLLELINELKFEENIVSKYLQDMKKRIIDDYYVRSFTENDETNKIMWSHYGGGGSGICLEFNVNLNGIQTSEGRLKFENIKYEIDIKHEIESLIETKDKIKLIRKYHDSDEMDLYKRKFISWEYEKEWRLILKKSNENKKGIKVKYDLSKLNSITFGVNAAFDKQCELIKSMENKCEFYRMKIEKNGEFSKQKIEIKKG